MIWMHQQRQSRILIATLLVWLLPLVLVAQGAAATLNHAVQEAINQANLGSARIAVMAVDLSQHTVLVDLHADQPMIPASNMKLLTTAAALDRLGMDHVYRTQLLYRPAAQGHGPSLAIRGSGDPAFADPKLLEAHGLDIEALIAHWVQAVQATGQKRFETLWIDDHVFDDVFFHPSWPADQLNRWYCAQVAGLNVHANCVLVTAIPGPSAGSAPQVVLQPEISALSTRMQARTVAAPNTDTFWVSRAAGSNQLVMQGQVRHRSHAPVPVTFHDPPMVLGALLRDRLKAAGIEVGSVKRSEPADSMPDARVLHVIATTMPVVLGRINSDSQNMYAEAVLKTMGHQLTGAPGSWENGAAAMRQALAGRIGEMIWDVRVSDGSGLSRGNRVTARVLATLLASMWLDDTVREPFRESLSAALLEEDGEVVREGSLARFNERIAALRPGDQLYGKTGFIRAVYALSGYLVAGPRTPDQPEQRVIAFSILVNNYAPPVDGRRLRTLQGRILALLADAP